MIRNNDYECLWFSSYNNDQRAGALPKVSITKIDTSNSQKILSGTADPNAVIDIYSTASCAYVNCSIRSYLQTVIADNNGNWKSNNLILNGNYYVSATVGNRTSLFVSYQINKQNVKIANIRCDSIASITGLQVPAGLSYHWVNQNGNIVSDQLNLQTTKPGKYQLILGDGCIASDFFEIDNDKVGIDTSGVVETNISCGVANGSIKNLFVYDPEDKIAKEEWLDAGGKLVGSSTNIDNLGPGTYYFKVFTTDGCETDYGPVTLKNVSGPNIDQSQAAIQPTNCGQSTGSITNLVVTGTGTLKYIWWNDQQQTVSTTQDLTSQPAGTYKLEVSDDSQCGPVYTTDITIPQTNGITLDESKVQTTVASCSKDNGTITGIIVTGATQYQWADANNKIAGTALDLQNAAPGDYNLTASNSFGCSATSNPYHIGQQPPTQFPVYTATIVPTCPGKSNGSVTVATDNLVNSARWVDSQGQTIGGKSSAITDLPTGTYQLFLTDGNGCENLYNSYNVPAIPQLQIVPGSEQIKSDHCGLKRGGVTNIQVTGGALPYIYAWLDANNNVVSSSPDLSGVGEGSYTLNVNDASGCGLVSAMYAIQNQNNTIPAPVASNVQLCSPGNALLQVSSPSSIYSYRLYDSETSTSPLDAQVNGVFKITVKTNTNFYVSQVSGDCESTRTDVQVSVGITSVDIANTFTPNGDGINDYWKIKGIENYPNATVQIFTRYGQKIFESRGYPSPFDGTLKGKPLPSGVYYYIINLSTNCSLLSGGLTIIR